jgi:hypothetical protein
VRVTLLLNGSTPLLAGDGPFMFPAVVRDGTGYGVTIATEPSGHTCAVDSPTATGTVHGAAVTNVAVHCPSTDETLKSLVLSLDGADVPLASTFDPKSANYAAGPVHVRSLVLFPNLVKTLTVTATASHPKATLTINGAPADSGVPNTTVSLDQGTNRVTVVVTAPNGATRTYVVGVEGTPSVYVKASNTTTYGQFGFSVALSGDTLVAGAPGDSSSATGIDGNQSDASVSNSGAVYVFTRRGATWAQQAYIKPSTTQGNADFGTSIALSGDTLVVGAPGESSSAGAAYVFTRSGTTWTQQAYVNASNARGAAYFGHSVALSGDTLAVGSDGESSGINGNQSDTSANYAGAVYVFTRTGANWTQQAYIKALYPYANALFGASVALSGDTLAVGSYEENSAATGINGNQADQSALNAGAAFVFTRNGTTWTQQAYVKASNTRAQAFFGTSVALVGDTLAVGSTGEASGIPGNQTDTGAPYAGAVYVFSRNGTTWAQEAYVKASNTRRYSSFGASVSLSGERLAVGSDAESGRATDVNGPDVDGHFAGAGAAYLFDRSAGWSQIAYIKASNTMPIADFSIVALDPAGLAVGAWGEFSSATGIDGNQYDFSAPNEGAVYVY